jgi:hypothetical protein
MWRAFAKKLEAAKAARPIAVVGLIWMQGEADAKDEASAKAYQANLTAFIQAVRELVGQPDLPFVAGRINPDAGKYTNVPEVRAAQAAITLPGYQMVDCDGLSKSSDNIHYNAPGQIELGLRFAAAMIKLLGPGLKR